MAPQILVDQFTLFEPGGADYAHHITICPLNFQTFLRPCIKNESETKSQHIFQSVHAPYLHQNPSQMINFTFFKKATKI